MLLASLEGGVSVLALVVFFFFSIFVRVRIDNYTKKDVKVQR